MKNFLFASFALISVLGFSQEQITKTQPLYISSINFTDFNFNSAYSDLDKISLTIMGKKLNIKSIDKIRQGQLVFSTANIGKSLKNIKIDMQPSLQVEAERVMYSGNFINPNQPLILCFD
ncbi:hypothetical protein [Lacinutrix jangbogonensis]|uniref:hypothetical protein n=1 Tax=Lacinutrix jangbogonensis TaxID=1469557 RepID=UPI00053DDCBE|nr:hypothetical protein [Lacinutrix jangbogonensis]